jgi:mono/diheme cytochrome c family protein
MRRSTQTGLLALVLGVLTLGVAGCGGGEEVSPLPDTVAGTLPATTAETTTAESTSTVEGDAAAGEKVFASAGCGGCHTLKAANSSGNVGPNLDDAKPGMALVIDRVTNGKGVMPSFKGQLDDKQIADVAAYVVKSTSG